MREHRMCFSHFKISFIYLLIAQYKLCDIMVHCRHASIHQLLGNQLLLGADATTRVLIITGLITIFSRNK